MTELLSDIQRGPLAVSNDSGMAEMAASTLHNIRKALSPRVGDTDMLGEDLETAPIDKLDAAQTELAQGTLPPVRIQDNGEGIEAKSLHRIFQRDSGPSHRSLTQTGLQWCVNTICAVKGHLYAESMEVDHGACFHLLLPVEA